MRRFRIWAYVTLAFVFSAAGLQAQQNQAASDGSSGSSSGAVAAVPRLIKFSGAVRDARGEPLTGVAVRLTFAVYSEQQGGAALWIEAQVTQLDEQGHYAVLLGATRGDGLPVELFPAGKARWLGIQVEGRDEDARVLLVSVPYALRAEDAAMLGGRRASDFVLAEQLKEEVKTQVEAQKPAVTTQTVEMLTGNPPNAPAIAEGPSTFTCATTGNCITVQQNGTGRAISTSAVSSTDVLFVQQTGTGYGLWALAPGNVAVFGQITGSAGSTYGVKGQTTSTTGAGVFGYNLATTGLAYGVLGQTKSTEGTAFFGRAVATTGATIGLRGHADSTSGTGIMGQATATSGTTTGILARVFSVNGTALIVDNTQGGKLLSGQVNGAEKLGVDGSGNLTTSGSVTATGFVGPLTGAASDLNCAACVAPAEVSFNYAGSASQGGAATTAATATNALSLGGVVAANYARLDIGNSFNGNQSVTGNITLTGSINTALRLETTAGAPNVVGGYSGNTVTAGAQGATIGGGGFNLNTNSVTDNRGTVAGGSNNQAGDNAGTTADRSYATVGGGNGNTASGSASTVAGGEFNTASGAQATICGGSGNVASATNASVVGGGLGNTASGNSSSVVGGGSGNTASGDYSTVAGGSANTASGAYGFAAGRRAKANHQGAFVWGDSTDADIASSATNQFIARAVGGVTFYTSTDLSTGVTVAAGGGSWSSVSDRNAKQNFAPVDGTGLLARLASIPVLTWNYKAQDASIRHLGPMAQDFYAAFQVGEDNKHIATVDADGVALAAIQALYQRSVQKDRKIEQLTQEVDELRARLTRLEQLWAKK